MVKAPLQSENNKMNFEERRREARLPAHLPSVLMKQDTTIYTTIINLSSQGIGFLSAVPLDADDQVEIKFERKDINTMVPVDLKVHVHSCHEVDFEYYIGGSISHSSLEYTRFFTKIESGETTDHHTVQQYEDSE